MLVWWLPAARAEAGSLSQGCARGLIPSLTQPVLGTDGRLATEQGALPRPAQSRSSTTVRLRDLPD